MFFAALSFTIMTTLVRYLGEDYPAGLQAFYRQAAAFLVLLPMIARRPRAAFSTARMPLQLFRAGATVIGFTLSFEAFRLLPLGLANVLSFTHVLWIVPLSVVVLRERISASRLGMVLIGFAGVMVMLRPEGTSAGWPVAAALGGALMLACANMSVKSLSGVVPMLPLLTWSAVLGTLAALPLAIAQWRMPSITDFLLLLAMGVAGVATQYAYVAGLRIGDTAVVVPVDYSRLVMATAVAYFLFGEKPDAQALFGASIIIASTLVILLRERASGIRIVTAEPPTP